MSQAKSQGVSFHPSQFAVKASTSNPGNEWKDFTEDDDDLDENQFKFVVKDHVLFCIDASGSMQDPLPDSMFQDDEFNKLLDPSVASKVRRKGKTPLHIALEAVHLYEKAKALATPQDSVGVLFYNVDPNTLPPTLANGERSETFRRGTVLYQPLRQVNVEEIKRVRSLLEEATMELAEQSKDETERSQPSILGETFKPINKDEMLDMADVFECCNHVFRDAGTKLNGTTRVFLITANDRPEPQVEERDRRVDPRAPARTRFMDLNSLGVSVDPYFISKPEEEFDQDYYWNDILARDIEDDEEPHDLEVREKTRSSAFADGFDKLVELMDVQAQRSGLRRVVFRIPLKFGGKDGDIEIGVQGYSLISAAVRPAYRLYDLSGRVAREVKTKTEYNAASTGAKLDPGEIGYAYNFGTSDVATDVLDNYWAAGEALEAMEPEDEELEDVKLGKGLSNSASDDVKGRAPVQPIRTRVTFTNAEIKQFKTLGLDPQIKIIGFQDEKVLRFDQNIKHAVFLYPDETAFAGSTRTFSALLTACARKKKHALALVITRRNTVPTFACLIPQEETFDEDGVQANPPGFHMIYLPFADDMRPKPEKMPSKLLQCDERQRDTFKMIIKKLKFQTTTYVPAAYSNPALAFFYAKLQAIAFDEATFEPDKVPDTTKPLYDGIRKNAGEWLRALNEMVNNDSRSHGGQTATARPPKRAAPDSGFDPAEADNLFATGKANKAGRRTQCFSFADSPWFGEQLLVAQLKEYARHKGIPLESNLKKADIIAKIEQHRRAGR